LPIVHLPPRSTLFPYTTLFRSILTKLIEATAAPLKAVEENFACDSSGFSACRFDRWYDAKWGGQKSKRSFVKAHIMCGVKTNVRSEEHTSELQSLAYLVCRLLL